MAVHEMKIADACAAAHAFVALGKITGPSRIPSDKADFVKRLQRTSGRGRPLAAALERYVEANGVDGLRVALEDRGVTQAKRERTDSDAAAIASKVDFEELDRSGMIFAAAGFY